MNNSSRKSIFRRPARRHTQSIQITIMTALTVVAVVLLVCVSFILYARFSMSARSTLVQNTQNVMEQTQANLEDYLRSMRQISDAVNFNVISEYDADSPELAREMGLIYESYKDRLVSIALYNGNGSLLAAAPTAAQKTDPNVSAQAWFQTAMDRIENMHFSTPHVQNLFDDATNRYHWVISLSRAVDVNQSSATPAGSTPQMGVLLVDMNYSTIAQILEQINDNESQAYFYLCDQTGQMIYHPEKVRISEGLFEEDSVYAASQTDGVYEDELKGERRTLVVQSIAYTGWKLVGVIPNRSVWYGDINLGYFVLLVLILVMMLLLIVNRIVSGRISRPILRLNESVRSYEIHMDERDESSGSGHPPGSSAAENDETMIVPPSIYIGGSTEIRHLGNSIQRSYEQINELMQQIVREQNERRRSELDALQSQINPHFLYNTLDSITWMVEGGRNEEAVTMISELAKLLRISISKGHTVIRMHEELQHARSYMNIQRFRYKDRFAVEYEIDPEVDDYCCVKLIIQPILENAIYYGVGDMDEDDGGRILVTARLEKEAAGEAEPAEPGEQSAGPAGSSGPSGPSGPSEPSGLTAPSAEPGEPAEQSAEPARPAEQSAELAGSAEQLAELSGPQEQSAELAAEPSAKSSRDKAFIVIEVKDNGLGMTKEEARHALTNDHQIHKHGSGVGLVNVNRRIQLIFGKEYGLQIESEPDIGTNVHIHFPAVVFNEENQRKLEEGIGMH